ncbi:MAG: GNAT family N-acetyltransferase [Deltaproteobacteria bacterium]|nr:GNAT family N-acetyltransferase [Deltaproteobacteria bacterium]MBW2052897.1 GNAT family N-acetyltransferase [Deltaproteobacteria bacterium]MBW2141684.1 GNAT family N-acetyltransferase [Deltaproteobacteria bacterium]
MKIERSVVEDLPEILILQKLAYRSEAEIYNDFSIPPLTQTLEEIQEDFRRQKFLKALANDKITGSCRAYSKGDTCYIGRLIVHPDFQNQGIGAKLMNKIEAIFKDAKRFEVFTGHKSERNIYLYQKLGYKQFTVEEIHAGLTLVYLEKFKPVP